MLESNRILEIAFIIANLINFDLMFYITNNFSFIIQVVYLLNTK